MINTKDFEKLDKYAREVCVQRNFTEEQIQNILIEMSARNVKRSFMRMPENLILSMYRKDIEHIRDFGTLSQG